MPPKPKEPFTKILKLFWGVEKNDLIAVLILSFDPENRSRGS
jgi:hypothetical protein